MALTGGVIMCDKRFYLLSGEVYEYKESWLKGFIGIVLFIALIMLALSGCKGSGGGSSSEEKPEPLPVFEVTGHQLYLMSHECLAECVYNLDCAKENCLVKTDDDQLCRGNIILPEVFGYNPNANTTELWYAVDFTDGGLWDGSYGGETEFIGTSNFSAMANQAYYITDPDTYRLEIWLYDANGNKTKPYHIFIDPEECY
jgi:hypothetical protein